METKIQYHVDKFVSFLFGANNENDPEQRIYNKLLRLEGDELESWMNEKLKNYITFTGFYCDFHGENFEGIVSPTLFKKWYNLHSIKESSELMMYDEIFDRSNPDYRVELYSIKLKLRKFQKPLTTNYDMDLDWKVHIMRDYMKMFIMTMSTEELKSYIIQQVDPVEVK
jgi:hypothetical protein